MKPVSMLRSLKVKREVMEEYNGVFGNHSNSFSIQRIDYIFITSISKGNGSNKSAKKSDKVCQIFKKNFSGIIFHKKTILAIVLLALTLYYVWAAYASTEYHFNAHSGYPPISTKLNAIYSMIGVFLYTFVLTLVIAFLKTLKIVKTVR